MYQCARWRSCYLRSACYHFTGSVAIYQHVVIGFNDMCILSFNHPRRLAAQGECLSSGRGPYYNCLYNSDSDCCSRSSVRSILYLQHRVSTRGQRCPGIYATVMHVLCLFYCTVVFPTLFIGLFLSYIMPNKL